jgi:hypothetical protein
MLIEVKKGWISTAKLKNKANRRSWWSIKN